MVTYPDLIILTETWLNNSVSAAESSLDGYMVYRCDRCPIKSGKSEGGGVLIAVNKDVFNSVRLPSTTESYEHLFVRIFNDYTNIIIGVAYIDPDTDANYYLMYAETFERIASSHPDADIATFGNFNLLNIFWDANPLSYHSNIDYRRRNYTCAEAVCTAFGSLGLNQVHPSLITDKDYSLDLLFTNINGMVFKSPDEILREIDSPETPVTFCVPLLYSKISLVTVLFMTLKMPTTRLSIIS